MGGGDAGPACEHASVREFTMRHELPVHPRRLQQYRERQRERRTNGEDERLQARPAAEA